MGFVLITLNIAIILNFEFSEYSEFWLAWPAGIRDGSSLILSPSGQYSSFQIIPPLPTSSEQSDRRQRKSLKVKQYHWYKFLSFDFFIWYKFFSQTSRDWAVWFKMVRAILSTYYIILLAILTNQMKQNQKRSRNSSNSFWKNTVPSIISFQKSRGQTQVAFTLEP